jgi:tyrosine-protein kinase Etk/Wzc
MELMESGNMDQRGSVPPGALVAVGPHALANTGDSSALSGSSDFGLLSILRRRYRVVLGVGATTFALVMALTLLSKMEFEASSRLYLGELDAKARSSLASAEDLELALGGQSDLASEIEILRSRSLLSRAVREAGLNLEISRLGASPVRYWQWRLSGREPSLLDAADKELRGVRTRLTDESQKDRRFEVAFTSATEFELWSPEVRSLRSRIPGRLLGRGRLNELLVLSGLELTLQSGSVRAPEAGARYQLLVHPVEDAVDAVLKTLEVTAPKSSGRGDPVKVVTLSFQHASPTLAAEFLEQLMRCYLQERQAWKTADASAVEAFVTEQLQITRTVLDDIQRKLADYRTKNRAVVLDNEAKAMIAQIGKYEEQRVAARLEVAALVDVDRSLSQPNLPIEAYMLGEAKDSVLEELAGSLSKARRELTDLEARYNASAPGVREQRAQLNAQLATIRGYVRARVRRAEDNLKTLDNVIVQYEDKLRTVPEAELGLAQLTRESQVYGALYSNLLMRQQQTAIVKASTVSRNRILDPARVGYREESPRLPLRLMSGVFGLLLGAGIVVLGRLLSNSYASEAEVQRSLSPLPVLVSVPKRRQRWAQGRRKSQEAAFDLLGGDVNFEFVEAFRALRTRLYQTALEPEGGQVLMVTSPCRGDGKTTVVLSLASILVADGKSVLVIDVDLRQGRATSGQAEPREADLRAAMTGQCEFSDALSRVTIAGGEYDFLGPDGSAPVELLASARMTEFLSEARERWDYVLIDVPSFPMVSDALSLAPAADAVLSVIRLGATPARIAVEHARRLSAAAHGQALIVNDPGSRRRQRDAYPTAPQRAFSKALGRSTWRDGDGTPPPIPRPAGARRLVLPLAGAALLIGVGAIAALPVSRDEQPLERGISSRIQQLSPSAAPEPRADSSGSSGASGPSASAPPARTTSEPATATPASAAVATSVTAPAAAAMRPAALPSAVVPPATAVERSTESPSAPFVTPLPSPKPIPPVPPAAALRATLPAASPGLADLPSEPSAPAAPASEEPGTGPR